MEGRRALDARERILATVDAVPRGRVATYGQVAREAGLSGRARLVGRCLRGLGPNSRIPWWRVLGAGGQVRTGSAQISRLRREGIAVSASGRVALERFGWRG